jgi:uncharacterized protein YndB with AHSA1/START domain
MWFTLKPVDLAFLSNAEKVYVVDQTLAASREDVWAAFVDPTTWHHWWPGLVSASYRGAPRPYGVGTFREATVGGQRFEERIVVWEEERRWGYRIDRATAPIAWAQLECTELEDHGTGTRVRWILALHPRLMMRLVGPFFPRIMRSLLRRAMASLDVYIATKQVRAHP